MRLLVLSTIQFATLCFSLTALNQYRVDLCLAHQNVLVFCIHLSCVHFQAISSQVYENHVTLESLEKDAKGLTQNFRSRETAALKSKLASVRRQWENLCARAKDRSTALSGSVAHWQRYQTLHEQLMPWIVKAEKYLATDLPKCASLEEAKDLYDLHQVSEKIAWALLLCMLSQFLS